MRCAGLIAAAGESTRMGSHKALLPVDGVTCTERLVATFTDAGLAPIFVSWPDALALDHLRLEPRIRFIRNCFKERELLGSIQSTIALLPDEIGTLLVCPIDAPLIDANLIQSLKEMAAPHRIVVPEVRGQLGHPIVFSRSFFADLMARDTSARALLIDRPDALLRLVCDTEAALHNWNSPADWMPAHKKS